MNSATVSLLVADIVRRQFDVNLEVEVTRPEEKFGDFATNVALQLAGRLQKQPREIAEVIAEKLRDHDQITEVAVAGPGFINMRLSDEVLLHALLQPSRQRLRNTEVLVEFGDPNPFKAMHLGHLYTTIVGDAVAHLLEHEGASVRRLSYHGDVGMHVAKAIWALLRYEGDIRQVLTSEKAVGSFYAKGATAYKDDPQAKAEIEELNRKIYDLRLSGKAGDKKLTDVYRLGFDSSFEAFERVFTELGVNYDKRYLESESTKVGLEYVKKHLGTVFEESDGAVIYRGEKAGLHTRVFVNSRGLPTYEAKDLGLTELKKRDYPEAAESIIITANEQTEYFKVMLAALAEFDPETATKTRHIAHGFLSLTSGKMSSRQGVSDSGVAANLLAAVRQTVSQQFSNTTPEVQAAVYLAAVKYTFLKNRIGGDIIFSVEESVALEGNSGPYLQYAHARARSILAKVGQSGTKLESLEPAERSLVRKLSEFNEVLSRACAELMPHHICTYLYELAQTFNRFYEQNRVLGHAREAVRATLVQHYADTLKQGLEILGIQAPDQI